MTDDALTRRDFVAATTLGAMGLLRVPSALAAHLRPRADAGLLYVGTYTEGGRREGIYLVRMNPSTGTLQHVGAVDAGPNPSFLTIHPEGRMLYAVNETDAGSVRAFSLDPATGALTPAGEQPSQGAAPCYVSTDRKGVAVFVANYTGGTVAMLPLDDNNALTPAAQVKQHVGSGPVTARQEKAHAHCIIPHPNNRFVYAADLGVDRVLTYRFDEETGVMTHLDEFDAALPAGTGPRHLAFHPTLPLLFVSGELNSTITTLRCDANTGALSPMQTHTTLPSRWSGANFPADIHVSADGRAVYVSNRGHNSIAVFAIAARTGALTQEQVIATAGDWPRNFAIDPTGKWLLVANQRSGSIVVFGRDAASGRLAITPERLAVPSPVCLRFQGGSSW